MKLIFVVFGLLLSYFAVCQKPRDNYSTKIGKAERVFVNKGVVTITKADTVIIKIYSEQAKSDLYLSAHTQFRDSTGIYRTTYTFSNPKLFQFLGVEIVLKFSHPIDLVQWGYGPPSATASARNSGCTEDNKNCWYRAGTVVASGGIIAEVWSKEKITVEISGIAGYLNGVR